MPEKWIPGHWSSVRAIYRGKSPDLTEGGSFSRCAPGKHSDREEKSSALRQRTDVW